MTLDDLEAELRRWTFLPGYDFELKRLEPASIDGISLPWLKDSAVLLVHSRVPNSHNPTETIKVSSTSPVPFLVLEGRMTVGDWLRQVVHARMWHEADEWLKRDGEMIYNPHAKDR
jgi:hypothetical protein